MMRLDAFRMISALAQIKRLFLKPHSSVKFVIFLILENPAVAMALKTMAKCFWPEWCLHIHEECGLDSLSAKHTLAMLAATIRCDVTPAEWGHAFVKRHQMLRGQTWAFTTGEASTQWVGRYFRRAAEADGIRIGRRKWCGSVP